VSASLLEVVSAQAPGRAWLLTFVDLILLLLTFFVLMFAMSQPDPAKFAPMALPQSVAPTLPVADPEPTFARARSFVSQAEQRGEDLAYLETALKTAFAQSQALQGIQFRANEQYLMLSLPAEPLSRELNAPAGSGSMLFDLAGLLANIDNRLAVIGLADQSAESWESAIRGASRVARLLERAGYDRPIATLARTEADQSGALEVMIMAESMADRGGAP
jgi:chemotaxis protein MotB